MLHKENLFHKTCSLCRQLNVFVVQENILACAIDVMDKSANLIQEAKKAVNNPNNPDNQTRLAQVSHKNSLLPPLIYFL